MASLKGDSTRRNVPAVSGESTAAGGTGVLGKARGRGTAVFGQAAPQGRGVVGVSANHTAVEGNTKKGVAVFGIADGAGGIGVVGSSDQHTGVEARSKSGVGVLAVSESGEAGVFIGKVKVQGELEADRDITLPGGVSLGEKLTEIDTKLIDLNTKLVSLGEKLAEFDPKLIDLNTKLVSLGEKLAEFDPKLIDLNTKLIDLKEIVVGVARLVRVPNGELIGKVVLDIRNLVEE